MRSPSFNHDRAKRAQEVINALLADGAPTPMWVAIRMSDGRTHGAAYPTKKAAMEHTSDPNHYTFLCVPTPMSAPSIAEIISFMRFSEMREAYWRTQEDQHLHLPTHGLSSGNASAYGV